MTGVVSGVVRHSPKVQPFLSKSRSEAKARVLCLYRAWYKQASLTVFDYRLPISFEQAEAKVREMFEANRHVKDLRVIDALVLKGQMELKEVSEVWQEPHHVMKYFKDTIEPPPSTFMEKFISGQP